MPPTFFSQDFEFENNLIPEHYESEEAAVVERDPTKYWLEYSTWLDQDTMGHWPLAVDIDDLKAAESLREARIRYLMKADQPKSEEEQLEIIGSVAIHEPEASQMSPSELEI